MEILDLRHFSSADLRPLLEEEIATWGQVLNWDYTTSAEMILRYMDAKILPGYAAIERGGFCGYSFFVYEQNKGVIGDLFVLNGGRGIDRQAVLIEDRSLTGRNIMGIATGARVTVAVETGMHGALDLHQAPAPRR